MPRSVFAETSRVEQHSLVVFRRITDEQLQVHFAKVFPFLLISIVRLSAFSCHIR